MPSPSPSSSSSAASAADPFDEDFGGLTRTVHALADSLAATAAARDRSGGTALAERQLLRQSGLLTLAIPSAFGGQQAAWPLIFRILRRLAQADSSLAHLFGFQHLQVASILLFGSQAQQARYLGQAVEHRWFWGNAVNARDTRLTATRTEQGLEIDGVKGFCSGASDSDVLNVSVTLGPEPTDRVFAVVPTSRAGIRVHDDWDNMGQRQTDSGSVSFERVQIAHDEVLGPPGVASSPRATLRNLIGQIVLTEIYLGNALGALREAIGYLRTQTQPWPMAGVTRSEDDRMLQLRAGEMWSSLRAATALSNLANERFQQAWDRGSELTAEERATLAVDVAAARTQAGRVALQVTSQIFELVGARGTAARHGFDRYWRNVRVHTLHDPLDYRHQSIGAWLLAGVAPNPYGYG
ncbi:monooxygenase [Variovorax atrisoli]|uniref:acyl-CoA dehydrogenase family protein n=1 Tax=Variovorax atrisoli TaxID=3394203 RepID=UPI000F7F4896|nr:acyl-CoA dehydrogenase family protein [Variovorax sp. 369]RTD86798.1 monooxygenase [Variovorax sp. 369]